MYRPFHGQLPLGLLAQFPFWQLDLTREIGSEPQFTAVSRTNRTRHLQPLMRRARKPGTNQPQVAGQLRPFGGLTPKAIERQPPHRAEATSKIRTHGGDIMTEAARYPGIRVTANGNQLVSYHTETRIADAGVFYPITPSTEGGELFQQAYAEGNLNVFGHNTIAIETEGEHAAQGGAIAHSVCGKRVVNFTSGQGVVYGVEQYYHAPGKGSTMVLEVGARALTKHALNVHCGHDDIYGALDTGWIMVFGKDAQQAADQSLILRRVTELSLTPGMNIMDGFLTSHLERTFYKHESELIREYLGAPEDIIDCPTEAQRVLFGPTRRRVPKMMDLTNPVLLGPVQNQEHYMNGIIARRNNFAEPILEFLEDAYKDFGKLTGRLLRADFAVQVRRHRNRLCFSRIGRRKHRSRGRLPAPDPRRQRGLHPRQRDSALPRSGHRRSAQGQEERHHPRADGRSLSRRQPARPRHPHRALQGDPKRDTALKACPR